MRNLTSEEQRAIDRHAAEMASILKVDIGFLNERTGSSYRSLKILLSLFRRLRSIAQFQKNGKVRLGGSS